MIETSPFSVTAKIELQFQDSSLCKQAFQSFKPELEKMNTKRSSVKMEIQNTNSLFFSIKCTDITAFRATTSDIIGFGKIIENTHVLVKTL